MASQKIIPRFLLPQSSWSTALPRRGLNSSLYANPHAISARTSGCAKPLPSFAKACRTPFLGRSAVGITAQAFRCFSTSRALLRDHHFDTLKFVQRLRDEGFSEEQSKAMMLVLSDVIEESIQNLTRTMVLKEGQQHRFSSVRCLAWVPVLIMFVSRRCGPLHLYPEG